MQETHHLEQVVWNDAECHVAFAEEQACEAEKKAARLKVELPQKVVEEFKGSTNFGDTTEEFLFGKIMEFHEILSGQIWSIDPNLDKVEVLSEFLQWKKGQAEREAPPSEGKDESSS